MPKATASWLIENTTLCHLNKFQILSTCICLKFKQLPMMKFHLESLPRNPIEHGELSIEEIKKCEKDQTKKFKN